MAVAELAEARNVSRIGRPSRVAVVGAGSREHAILDYAREFSDTKGHGTQLYALPGNPGTAEVAKNLDGVIPTDIDSVVRAVHDHGIEFVAIGPERPMAMGLTDALEEEGVEVFGHTQDRMWLEASKADAVKFMRSHGIPHPDSEIFTDPDAAELFMRHNPWRRTVVKADGLTEGKGVSVPEADLSDEEAMEVSIREARRMLSGEAFGEAGKRIVLQEQVEGVEASMIGFVSNEMGFLVPARDYKSLLEDGEGPNTGGMGAYAPNEIITHKIYDQFIERIAIPTQMGMKSEGQSLTGPVYFGLMITKDGPVVLEYNMRFGDPETAVQLALFRGDLLKVMQDTRNGILNSHDVYSNENRSAVGVFAVSEGYPVKPVTGREIKITDDARYYADIYQAGTKRSGDGLVTSGGRVILAVGTDVTRERAAEIAYKGIDGVKFEGKHVRTDIGE